MKNQFKVGDLVYIFGANKIGKIIELLSVNTIKVHNQKEYFHSARLCHATQENYELLSKLYPNVSFEPPPKRKESSEIIKAMLESGWYRVPVVADGCLYFVNSTINHISRNWQRFYPFDPKTGKTIIDFVDGEVVLESENE